VLDHLFQPQKNRALVYKTKVKGVDRKFQRRKLGVVVSRKLNIKGSNLQQVETDAQPREKQALDIATRLRGVSAAVSMESPSCVQ